MCEAGIVLRTVFTNFAMLSMVGWLMDFAWSVGNYSLDEFILSLALSD